MMSTYNPDPFWDYLHQLRQTGTLCDIQLFVKNPHDEFVSIYAHKVILAASSYYFQSCLSQGELLDVYNFDGIHVDNLQIVLDYMYHQISWRELQSNAEATIAAKTLGIMEQVQNPASDQSSVLKDAEGNKVLLVKRFSMGRKGSGGGAAKSSSLSKRVILPKHEIAKLIVNRRHLKPLVEVSAAWGNDGVARIGGFDQGGERHGDTGQIGHGDTGQLVALPPEEGQIVNSGEMTQGMLYISNTPSQGSDQPSLSQQLNSVVVDQDGHMTLYAEPDKMEEPTPDETGSVFPGNEDTAHVYGNEQEQQEEQSEARSTVKEQVYSSEQCGNTNSTHEADGQSCNEAISRDGDMLTENTDVPTGDEPVAITPIVDDLKVHAGDDTKDITDGAAAAVERDSGSINNTATLQIVPVDKVCKTDAQELGDGDATVVYDKPEISETPKETDSETRSDSVKCDDSDLSTPKEEPTCDVVKSKQRKKTPAILTPVIMPTRSRRIRRPPRDELYEWTLPSMRRYESESESTIESPTQTPVKQKQTRVVVKKEVDLETAPPAVPSEEPIKGEKLLVPLCDVEKSQKTTTQTRPKRKAGLGEMEESPDDCIGNTSDRANKKPKFISDEDEPEHVSPARKVFSILDPEGSADNSPEAPPVKRRRGRPKLKKDVKLEQWADAKDMASNPDVCMCSWCGKVFKNSTGLSIHENWVHKGLGQREGSTDHECSICSKVCRSFAALRNHEKQKHNVEREWACATCGAIFGKSKELKKHCMREHGEQRYECDVCCATFISREGWKIHMYKQHTDAKPSHMCDVCGKVFKMKHELKIHCKITHSTRRDFACQLCERSFKNNVTLTRHLLTYHSNVRNYNCDVCNRAFKTNMDMKKHRERHFRENDPLTKEGKRVRKHPDGLDYPCQFCGKIFYKRYLAIAHENLQHRQKEEGVSYRCTVCDKVFPIKHYLMAHISNKHRPRRFKCLRCQRHFSQQYELRKHQLGRCQGRPDFMKPHECEHCGRKFTLKGNLTKHMQAEGRCKRVHQSQVIDYIVVVAQDGEGEMATPVETLETAESLDNAQSLETAEALATLQTAQALQLLQNPDTLQNPENGSELPGNQELQMAHGLDCDAITMAQHEEHCQPMGEAEVIGEQDIGTMLHIREGEGGDGQVHILEIHPGEGGEQGQQIEISQELAAQLGATQENIIVQIVPAEGQEGEGGYEETM